LILIFLLFGPLLPPRLWILHSVLASLGVCLGLLWLNPELRWYVGLSGALHGLFAVGVLTEGQRDRRFAGLVLAIFAAKVVWEQIYGPLPGSEQSAGGPVIVDAHLYGAISGILTYAVFQIIQRIAAMRR
jgi:rhomboid family GlyGly-CTERM serine protease